MATVVLGVTYRQNNIQRIRDHFLLGTFVVRGNLSKRLPADLSYISVARIVSQAGTSNHLYVALGNGATMAALG